MPCRYFADAATPLICQRHAADAARFFAMLTLFSVDYAVFFAFFCWRCCFRCHYACHADMFAAAMPPLLFICHDAVTFSRFSRFIFDI